MPDTLAQKVRAKYPGVYNDLSDADLEARIKAKYPGVYDDLPTTGAQLPPAPSAPPDVREPFNRAVGSMLSDLNPIPLAQHVWQTAQQSRFGSPEVAGRLIWDLLKGQGAQFPKAYQAAREGRVSEAVGYGAAGMLPVVGPAAARAGETMGRGEVPEGIGQSLALLLTMGLPGAARAMPEGVTVPPLMRHPNPQMAEAVSSGLRAGIPVDLGTASGSGFIKALEAAAEHTPGGAIVAHRAAPATAEALKGRLGGMADQVFPSRVTPEQAGTAAQRLTDAEAKAQAGTANQSYRRLRELEGAPESERLIQPVTGDVLPGVTPAEMQEVRRIVAELEEVQYTRRGMHETTGQGSTKQWTAGHRNAYVYEDIMNQAGGSKLPAVELRGKLEAALNGEKPSVWFTRALEVARKRLSGDKTVHPPLLPPDAGGTASVYQTMAAPVDLAPAKARLKPVADELEAQLGALKGLPGGMRLSGADQQASQTLANVRRLMEMPDKAPASAVDPLLSTLKRYVAGADSALARTRGQGIIAGVIKELEGQLQSALAEIGPEAVELLQTGRQATKDKYAALEARKGLGKKSVGAYRKLVQPGDANLEQLQTIAHMSPQVRPVLGRAWLQRTIDMATADGGFSHAARIAAEWDRLGAKTKALIFPDANYVKDLDRFFRLAKELKTSYNPSGTALVGTAVGSVAGLAVEPISAVMSVLGAGGFAKAMHSPAFVKALTEGMRLPVRARTQRAAAVEQAIYAGREAAAGSPVALPGLAGERPDEPSTPMTGPSGSTRR